MKSITLLLFLHSTTTAGAEVLFHEDFDKKPAYVIAKGPNDNNISFVSFGASGSKFPAVKVGEFGGTAQYLADTDIGGGMMNGAFSIGSNTDTLSEKSRNRSYVTFIDTSEASPGQYNLSFDVSDFQSAGGNTRLYCHLYEGGGTVNGFLDFRLTFETALPKVAPLRPEITPGKGATAERVLVDNPITGNGRFSLNFALAEAGRPGNYLALVWSQVKLRGIGRMPSMSIDNLKIARLPEPPVTESSADIPAGPFGQNGAWKLRGDVSDEFDAPALNPQKWNSNPASWGAWSWEERNVIQKDGRLRLQMVHEPHNRNDTNLFYKSGIVRSHRQMTYGYYEARIKGCPLFPGACPAFWAYSDGRKYSGKVRYCEVDFVELQMNELNPETKERAPVEHIEMNLHLRMENEAGKVEWLRPNSHPGLCANSWTAPWDPRKDFHIYGCEVKPETITWFIDGRKVAEKPNKHWHLPMNIALSLGLRHPHIGWEGQNMKPVPGAATAKGFPTAMEVDWVRVWERQPE